VTVAIHRVRDLEIDEDLDFERRSQRVERIGLVVMGLVVLAALLGLLGSGPLSHATAVGTGVALDYDRFTRFQTDQTLTVHVAPPATGREVRLWLDREFLDAVRLDAVLPPALRVEAAPDRAIFVFAVAEPARPLRVTLRLQPERIGPLRGRAGLEGPAAATVRFRQFVLP
jgi:hypothetical protein